MADMLNFESFDTAFITMFVVASGDRWDLIMDATS